LDRTARAAGRCSVCREGVLSAAFSATTATEAFAAPADSSLDPATAFRPFVVSFSVNALPLAASLRQIGASFSAFISLAQPVFGPAGFDQLAGDGLRRRASRIRRRLEEAIFASSRGLEH
jgi:hypothetical protein